MLSPRFTPTQLFHVLLCFRPCCRPYSRVLLIIWMASTVRFSGSASTIQIAKYRGVGLTQYLELLHDRAGVQSKFQTPGQCSWIDEALCQSVETIGLTYETLPKKWRARPKLTRTGTRVSIQILVQVWSTTSSDYSTLALCPTTLPIQIHNN